MPGKFAHINFDRCDPKLHNPRDGRCVAADACKKKLLIQEEPFDGPMLMSASMCVGCGDCVHACPACAISIERSG